MEDEKIQVSVIIPIYNGAKYLKKCLDSVIGQTMKSLEIICIDDGSVDSTHHILNDYRERYPDKIKIFHTKNQGVWKARELGIKKACGTYVGFVDCDDHIEPDMYEKMYFYAARNNADMAVAAYWRILESDKKRKKAVEMNTQGNTVWKVNHDIYKFSFINVALWNKIILRKIAMKHIELSAPPRIAEDTLFMMSIYPYIHCIAFLETPFYHYYMRNGTAASYIERMEVDNVLENFTKTKNHIKDITANKEWEDTFEIASYIHLGASLLLRCRLTESFMYIRKVTNFLKKEFVHPNLYMKKCIKNSLLKIKLLKIAYETRTIYFVPFLKKILVHVIRW